MWLAAQGSSKVSLYHAATYEQLTEVDVAPAVAAKLQGDIECESGREKDLKGERE